jgi:hypothetical protein
MVSGSSGTAEMTLEFLGADIELSSVLAVIWN